MAQTDPSDANLPVPAESPREYFRVRPTDESLDPHTVETQFRRLHQVEGEKRGGLLGRFRSGSTPIIECLLVSPGDDDTLQYLFGIEGSNQFETLEGVLRGLFPNTYEIDRVTRSATHLDGLVDPNEELAAVEFCGCPERRADWQTRLNSFEELQGSDRSSTPLAAVVETMATRDTPMVYQALLQPKPNWTSRAEQRRLALETQRDTLGGQLSHAIWGPPDGELSLPISEQHRIEELEARDTRRSFDLNARLIAVANEDGTATGAGRELASTFAGVSHTCYEIEGTVRTGDDARTVFERMCERQLDPPTYDAMTNRVPFTSNKSRGIVADATEAPSFCLLAGDALTQSGSRAVAPTPGERTALPRPPFEQLENYRGDGFLLGKPLTQDGTPDTEPLCLPPSLQSLHLALFGKTGSGKSISVSTGILTNHAATDGADIIVEPKGGDMVEAYLRTHYATYGTLENVIYFDCAEVLPAFSFFDIRDELDAGVSRTTAVEDTVDHYIEILTQIMGQERFDQAVRSPDVIRYLTKAMFDPVSGDDAFSHRELHSAVRQMHERQAAPTVSDEDLERMLAGVVANRSRSFDEIMQGVANRMEKIPVDRRLARVFNHVPDEGDPHFDLADHLDDDTLIIFDTGGLRSEAQRVLTLVILSNLWTALRRRARRDDGDRPLVNLYVEEAASIAVSDLLRELLSQSRGFGCSVTLSMQFPKQVRDRAEDAYSEVLNNISTIVTGNVSDDRRLAERLATDDMNPQAVANRLRALRRGQWLVNLPAAFDEPEPRPFLVESASPPPGHPDGDRPLTESEERAFQSALETLEERTRADAGLTLESPSTVDRDDQGAGPTRVDSALPHTNRLPPTVAYHADAHILACKECDARYDPDVEGMRSAIECCGSLDRVDTDDVPICELNLKLKPSEREATGYTDRQLMFLQAVYNAQQRRYDEIEYDLVYDSMIRLQEYTGVDSEAVQDLIDDGLLTQNEDRPHRLYTVTPTGRNLLGERYRKGEEYGHGKGDLEETSQHILGVEVTSRWVDSEFAQDPDSEAEIVVPYFDLQQEDGTVASAALAMGDPDRDLAEEVDEFDHRRLDVAALDGDGNVVVAVEIERINHDARRAIPKDYDKMAECDPEEAIWVAMSHADAHEILAALNDPLEGEPRVEKTYAEGTPAHQLRLDAPGCTGMYTLKQVREMVDERE